MQVFRLFRTSLLADKVIFRQVKTAGEFSQAMAVRRAVFIEEQNIPAEEEYDGLDDTCLQFVAMAENKVIGTARVRLPSPDSAKVERMAVLKQYRRQGVGIGIIDCIIKELGKQRIRRVILHAQWTAISFYRSCGFETTGTPFDEAGIRHVKMQKYLAVGGSAF